MLLATVLQSAPPNDIWNDPNALTLISIGVAVVVGIGGIAIGIWGPPYQVRKLRTRKEITYEKVSAAPIITVKSDVVPKHSIEVLLDGKPAKEIHLLVFEVKNTGTSTIRREDYFESVTFNFEGQVVEATVLKTKPERLLETSSYGSFLELKEEKKLQLLDCPLNAGEAVTFSVLVNGEGNVNVRGRIDIGGLIQEFSPAEELKKRQRFARQLRNRGAVVGIVLLGLGIVMLRFASGNAILSTVANIGEAIGTILLLLSMLIWVTD